MENLEELKNAIKSGTDKQLAQIISHGALQLTDIETDTISFVFWITYIAEQGMHEIMIKAWDKAKNILNPDNETMQYIREGHKIKNEIIDPTDPKYSPNDITFTNKIDILQKICGDTKLTRFLWKLKDIRNDLSHGRIKNLSYNDKNLYLRETKEEMIIDFFECLLNNDWENAKFWKDLTDQEKKDLKDISKKSIF